MDTCKHSVCLYIKMKYKKVLQNCVQLRWFCPKIAICTFSYCTFFTFLKGLALAQTQNTSPKPCAKAFN